MDTPIDSMIITIQWGPLSRQFVSLSQNRLITSRISIQRFVHLSRITFFKQFKSYIFDFES